MRKSLVQAKFINVPEKEQNIKKFKTQTCRHQFISRTKVSSDKNFVYLAIIVLFLEG